MKVALKDIVDALEMQFDEYLNYLDRQTGKIEMVSRDELNMAEEGEADDELQNAIHGAGAFRYFKDTLRRYRREKDWYAYREEALRQIAIDWCEENGIEYTES